MRLSLLAASRLLRSLMNGTRIPWSAAPPILPCPWAHPFPAFHTPVPPKTAPFPPPRQCHWQARASISRVPCLFLSLFFSVSPPAPTLAPQQQSLQHCPPTPRVPDLPRPALHGPGRASAPTLPGCSASTVPIHPLPPPPPPPALCCGRRPACSVLAVSNAYRTCSKLESNCVTLGEEEGRQTG